MKKTVFFIFAVLFTVFSSIDAQTPVVKKRQMNQQTRINQGVKSGELTKRETVKLQKQQRNVRKTKRAAKADGVVTRGERAVIQHKQNKANRNIYRKKHNQLDRD
ncbi:hypothetical protein [Marinilabilia rubra]|uniref:DUF4890 domain-containing protein n=1 Tax=Marinilabilia rubra TaxID=2162893 RepID=A0A2U2B4C7_9BACT|nr:hypothetical protein [Marinilabilia rubra]PWD97920.1 hypothetical protein DDZ16_18360 [Marinilabilia rubra]